jgi:hypothetical protein
MNLQDEEQEKGDGKFSFWLITGIKLICEDVKVKA